MADILIRDLPDEVVAAIDQRAARLGLTRAAYLRRTLDRERIVAAPVDIAQLQRLADLAEDLDDPTTMSDAWS